MSWSFRDWLVLVEATGVSISPNRDMPGHLRPLSITVPYSWMQQKRAGSGGSEATHTFQRAAHSEKFFDTFFPGKDVHVSVEGSSEGRFWTKMQFGYAGETGWDAWHAARRDFLDGGEPVSVEFTIDLAPAGEASGGSRESEAYLAGYAGYHEPQVRRLLPSSGSNVPGEMTDHYPAAALQRAYHLGRYDATHFYAYGTSFPGGLEAAPIDFSPSYTWTPSKGTLPWTLLMTSLQPAMEELISDELARYPKKLADYIRDSFNFEMLHAGVGFDFVEKSWGVERMRKWIKHKITELLDKNAGELQLAADYAKEYEDRLPRARERLDTWKRVAGLRDKYRSLLPYSPDVDLTKAPWSRKEED